MARPRRHRGGPLFGSLPELLSLKNSVNGFAITLTEKRHRSVRLENVLLGTWKLLDGDLAERLNRQIDPRFGSSTKSL